jgi:hypothetical protein
MTTLQQYIKGNKPLKVKKGSRTTAYLYQDKVYIRSIDQVKEALALGMFPDSPRYPEVTSSNLIDEKDFNVYEMPVYKQPRSLKGALQEDEYKLYQALRSFHSSLRLDYDTYERYNDFVKAVQTLSISEDIKEDLIGGWEACMNYSNRVGFEISPRNVAVSEEGKLIFLDCFFIYEVLAVFKDKTLANTGNLLCYAHTG